MKKIGLLHTTIREDEKLIIEAGEKLGISVTVIDVRRLVLDLQAFNLNCDIYLERCVSTVKGTYVIQFLESIGERVVNTSGVSIICQDKFLTSLTLKKAKVPTPKFSLAFNLDEVKAEVKNLGGFPIVIKPPLGSWGRLLSKVNDIESLETVIEHKEVLGGPNHHVYYLQEYIKKPQRDIRAFVVRGEVVAAIYRTSDHWITNTARGGKASKCDITLDIQKICKKASDAVGGGILAMDIFETDDGLTINEINHAMEFKNSEAPTGVSISGKIVEYCLKEIK